MSLFCIALLNSGKYAQISAAVQWCWCIQHLYEEAISIGVIAVTQGSCEPVLQSTAEQWEMHFAQISAAVQWLWCIQHLYEDAISIIAVTEDCCEQTRLTSASVTEQQGCRQHAHRGHLWCCSDDLLQRHVQLQNLIGVNAATDKADLSFCDRAAGL